MSCRQVGQCVFCAGCLSLAVVPEAFDPDPVSAGIVYSQVA